MANVLESFTQLLCVDSRSKGRSREIDQELRLLIQRRHARDWSEMWSGSGHILKVHVETWKFLSNDSTTDAGSRLTLRFPLSRPARGFLSGSPCCWAP